MLAHCSTQGWEDGGKLAPDDQKLKDLASGVLGRECGVNFNNPAAFVVVRVEGTGIDVAHDRSGDLRIVDAEARGELDERNECLDDGLQLFSTGGWTLQILCVHWGGRHDDELEGSR
jgi:hypothetical protein